MIRYWLSRSGGSAEGPFCEAELLERYERGEIRTSDSICLEDAEEWEPALPVIDQKAMALKRARRVVKPEEPIPSKVTPIFMAVVKWIVAPAATVALIVGSGWLSVYGFPREEKSAEWRVDLNAKANEARRQVADAMRAKGGRQVRTKEYKMNDGATITRVDYVGEDGVSKRSAFRTDENGNIVHVTNP